MKVSGIFGVSPLDTKAALEKAEDQHRQGRLDEAMMIYKSVLIANPSNANACYGVGTIYLQQKDYSRSHELLEKAIQLEGNIPEFVLNLAMAQENLQRPEEAVDSYLKAIHLAPGDTELLIRAGFRLLALGHENRLHKLLRHYDVSTPQFNALKAQTEIAVGNWVGAMEIMQKIVRLDPASRDNWRKLSTAAAHIRDYQTAISAYRKYLSLSPENADDLLAYVDLLLMARDIEEANRVMSQVRQKMPDTAHSHLLQAKCARISGDYQSAREHVLNAIELAPELGEAWQWRLETEPEASRLALAKDCEKIAVGEKVSPRDKIMLALTAGRAYELFEEYEQAFSCFMRGKDIQKQQLLAKNATYNLAAAEKMTAKIGELFSSPVRLAPNSQAQPIFIVGMPRSGTTLVERIIGEHEGVTSTGENEAIEFIAAQYYWELEQGRQASPQQLAENDWRQMREEYWRRSKCAPALITDKMPHNFRHVGLILSLFPAAPIIYLRRDPRDVCLSIYSRMFPDGHRYACDLQWLAHFYHQSTRIMSHWQKTLPGKILEIKFEELVADPEAFGREIVEFCGLKWNPKSLDFHKNRTSSFTFSEMQVRRPLNSDGVGRWRYYASALAPLTEALLSFDEI